MSFVVYEYKPLINALMSAQTRGVTIKALWSHLKRLEATWIRVIRKGHATRFTRCSDMFGLTVTQNLNLGQFMQKLRLQIIDKCLYRVQSYWSRDVENIEAGFLIKGGNVPGSMREHLQDLIDTKVLQLA